MNTLDDTRGRLVLRPGARATIHLEDEGNLPRSLARSTLYWALLDGRCHVPPEVYVELELDRPTPRVIEPGCDIQVA